MKNVIHEYIATYTTECKAIDELINSGEITYSEYRILIQDACDDFTQALAKL